MKTVSHLYVKLTSPNISFIFRVQTRGTSYRTQQSELALFSKMSNYVGYFIHIFIRCIKNEN